MLGARPSYKDLASGRQRRNPRVEDSFRVPTANRIDCSQGLEKQIHGLHAHGRLVDPIHSTLMRLALEHRQKCERSLST
jgi:hypothetical protein